MSDASVHGLLNTVDSHLTEFERNSTLHQALLDGLLILDDDYRTELLYYRGSEIADRTRAAFARYDSIAQRYNFSHTPTVLPPPPAGRVPQQPQLGFPQSSAAPGQQPLQHQPMPAPSSAQPDAESTIKELTAELERMKMKYEAGPASAAPSQSPASVTPLRPQAPVQAPQPQAQQHASSAGDQQKRGIAGGSMYEPQGQQLQQRTAPTMAQLASATTAGQIVPGYRWSNFQPRKLLSWYGMPVPPNGSIENLQANNLLLVPYNPERQTYNDLIFNDKNYGVSKEESLSVCIAVYVWKKPCPYGHLHGVCIANHNVTQAQINELVKLGRLPGNHAVDWVNNYNHHPPVDGTEVLTINPDWYQPHFYPGGVVPIQEQSTRTPRIVPALLYTPAPSSHGATPNPPQARSDDPGLDPDIFT
jgi:hypothetical protein